MMGCAAFHNWGSPSRWMVCRGKSHLQMILDWGTATESLWWFPQSHIPYIPRSPVIQDHLPGPGFGDLRRGSELLCRKPALGGGPAAPWRR